MAQPDGKQFIARLSNVILTLSSPLSIRHELTAWDEARSLLHFEVRDPWGGYFGVGLVHASPRCGRLINLYYLPDTAISFPSSSTRIPMPPFDIVHVDTAGGRNRCTLWIGEGLQARAPNPMSRTHFPRNNNTSPLIHPLRLFSVGCLACATTSVRNVLLVNTTFEAH